MRKQHKRSNLFLIPVWGGLLLAAAVASARPVVVPGPYRGIEGPLLDFGSGRPLAAHAVLFDESADSSLQAVLAEELRRLSVELFDRQGWRSPFTTAEPLRIVVSRRDAGGAMRLAARAVEKGKLGNLSVEIDGSALSEAEIVREAGRRYAEAVLAGYGVRDDGPWRSAAARLLAGDASAEDEEAVREAAASPEVDLSSHREVLGRRYLDEFAIEAGGPAALRLVWESASERGEDLSTALTRTYVELTGGRPEELLLRFAARLYAEVEAEASPSRIGLFDLETGALDASPPAAFSLRHRTYLAGDPVAALRFEWPEAAGAGAVVVRYRDPALPPDVLFLIAGTVHSVPLAGVARVDWMVAGSGVPGGPAPTFFEALDGFPFSGLSAHAAAGAEGPRIWWTTASHEQLTGWAVFREEVLPDGRIARTGPEVLPAADAVGESFGYAYLDPAAGAGTFYRYTIWAVTDAGLLARAFSATLRTPE